MSTKLGRKLGGEDMPTFAFLFGLVAGTAFSCGLFHQPADWVNLAMLPTCAVGLVFGLFAIIAAEEAIREQWGQEEDAWRRR